MYVEGVVIQSPMNITAASNKADIIDASIEVIDTQAEQIAELKQERLILISTSAFLLASLFLF